jgi:hypothetical protein
MYLPADEGDALGAIELALAATLAPSRSKPHAQAQGWALRAWGADRGAAAVEAGVITPPSFAAAAGGEPPTT